MKAAEVGSIHLENEILGTSMPNAFSQHDSS